MIRIATAPIVATLLWQSYCGIALVATLYSGRAIVTELLWQSYCGSAIVAALL